MAELVAVAAASHAPLIARDWARFDAPLRARLSAAYEALGARLDAARPDVVVEIAPDHWSNFFIDNLPSVCVGVGERHAGPPEPFLRDFPHRELEGDPVFGSFLLETALAAGFEPSVSHRLTLDHGFCIPLWRMRMARLPRIVPLIINVLEPPMPAVRRCADWGELVASAVAAFPGSLRVAVLASGGLSHSIGEPTMGDIDPAFDTACIEAFRVGGRETALDFLERTLPTAGNGTHEVRNWLVAHAAAGYQGFELVDYLPVPDVYVGCGWAGWQLSG